MSQVGKPDCSLNRSRGQGDVRFALPSPHAKVAATRTADLWEASQKFFGKPTSQKLNANASIIGALKMITQAIETARKQNLPG